MKGCLQARAEARRRRFTADFLALEIVWAVVASDAAGRGAFAVDTESRTLGVAVGAGVQLSGVAADGSRPAGHTDARLGCPLHGEDLLGQAGLPWLAAHPVEDVARARALHLGAERLEVWAAISRLLALLVAVTGVLYRVARLTRATA